MTHTKPTTPTPMDPALQELLRVFAQHDAELRFPDVSHEALSQELEAVQETEAEVRALKEQLAHAQESLMQKRQRLMERARRGHAYASVYAEAHPDLAEELAAITFATPGRTTRKRATKKKERKATENQLSIVNAQADQESEAEASAASGAQASGERRSA
jgi:hypothetical protein